MITTYKELKEAFYIFRETNAKKLKSGKLLISISKAPGALIGNNTVIILVKSWFMIIVIRLQKSSILSLNWIFKFWLVEKKDRKQE